MEARTPPADTNAEMALVGSMIIGPECIEDVLLVVSANDFTDGRNAVLFMGVVQLHRKVQTQIDGLQLQSLLEHTGKFDAAGGYDYLNDIIQVVPSAAHAMHYAGIVRTLSIARQGISEAYRLAAALYTDPTTAHEALNVSQTNLAALAVDGTSGGELAASILPRVIDRLTGTKKEQEAGTVRTYFNSLDNIMKPMREGGMYVIAALTKHGKSTLAEHILANNASMGVPGSLISFEMGKEEMTERLLFCYSGLTEEKIRSGKASPQEQANFSEAHEMIRAGKIVFDADCRPRMREVRATVRHYQRKYGIKMAVLDYFQMMEGDDPREKRHEQLVQISRAAKRMAKDLRMVIILLAQLHNRFEKEDRRPSMHDIRDCVAPTQDADGVVVLDWEWHRKRNNAAWVGDNELIKHQVWADIPAIRGQQGGSTFMRIQPATYSFYDWDENPAQAPLF